MVNVGNILTGAGVGAGIAIVITGVDNFSRTFTKAQVSTKALGKSVGLMAAGTVLALGAIGAKAVSTASSFESAFAGVKKTSDLTESEFEDLENRFKEMTKTTPQTFEELSKIGEIAGQLGVEGVDNLEKFTKTVADIAVTTNLTAENAATSFARIANIMGTPLSQVDKMASSVVDLGNNFATTEAEIVEFANRIASAGKIVGMTEADIFAIGTALSSVGVQAEAGGTAVQRVLLDINKSVMTSDDKLEAYARTAGRTVNEFSELWRTDATRAFEAFVIGLGEQGDEAINTLEDVGMENVRTTRALLSLANAGDLLSNTLETSSSAWDENLALTEEAGKRYETFESQVAMVKNEFRLLWEELGKELMPIVQEELLPTIKDDLIPALKDIIPVIGDILILLMVGLANGLKVVGLGFKGFAEMALNAASALAWFKAIGQLTQGNIRNYNKWMSMSEDLSTRADIMGAKAQEQYRNMLESPQTAGEQRVLEILGLKPGEVLTEANQYGVTPTNFNMTINVEGNVTSEAELSEQVSRHLFGTYGKLVSII